MDNERFEFRRRAVQPMQCLREGWRLVKSNYWLFLGITFVGSLVAGMGPMGILVGPMMCGIHLCFLRAERGLPIEFSMLFKGFDYFMPSFVATLLMFVPGIVMMIGIYALFFFGMIAGLANFGPQQRGGGGPPGEEFGFFMISLMTIMFVSIMLFSTVIQAIFFFVFPLIVDRELSGWEAVSLSFRAFLANFFGVLALIILIMVLSILSLLACYVGVFFFVPISMAMTMAAYRQVFPEMESPLEKLRDFDDDDDDHPPAPRWSQSTSTDITSESR